MLQVVVSGQQKEAEAGRSRGFYRWYILIKCKSKLVKNPIKKRKLGLYWSNDGFSNFDTHPGCSSDPSVIVGRTKSAADTRTVLGEFLEPALPFLLIGKHKWRHLARVTLDSQGALASKVHCYSWFSRKTPKFGEDRDLMEIFDTVSGGGKP